MPEPLLHRTQVDTGPQAASSKRCPKLMKPESFLVEFSPFSASLQAVQKIELRVAPRRWKHQSAGLVRPRPSGLQSLHEFGRNRDLAFLVGLWRPVPIRLVADSNR